MATANPVRQLPTNPNITQLKNQAKDLKKAVTNQDAGAIDRVLRSHPSISESSWDPSSFTLRDAQVTLAREYGFDGWNQLSTHVGEQMIEERDLHRWFGVQLNNQMWERIEDDGIGAHTDELDKERMLYSAYASAYHWRNVGNEAHFARGEHLISRMAARIGEAEVALRHARRCLELVENHPDRMEDWDLAFAEEALARAYAANGDLRSAREHFIRAREVTENVGDEEDRSIVEAELERGPWFGMTA